MSHIARLRPSMRSRPQHARVSLRTLGVALSASLVLAAPALAADTTPPSPVTNVVAKVDPGSVAGNSFDISWNATTDDVGVTEYDVYSFTTSSGGQAQLIQVVPGNQTTLLNVQIPGDPSAGVTVVAVDAAGNRSDQALVARINTCGAIGPPTVTPPQNVAIAGITGDSATVSWNPSQLDACFAVSATGYDVLADNGAATPTLLTHVDATQDIVRVTGLTPATPYKVFIRPTGGARVTSSVSVQFTTLAVPATPDTSPPSAPGSVATSSDVSNRLAVTVTWTASTDDVSVAAYDIYSGSTLLASVSADQTSARVSAPIENPSTPFSVVALDAAGNASTPGAATANTCHKGPPAIIGAAAIPTVTATTTTTASITWGAPSKAECYRLDPATYDVFQDNGPGVTPTLLGSTNTTSIVLTGLAPGTTTSVYIASVGYSSSLGITADFPVMTKSAAPVDQSTTYGIKGTATLKNLVKGSLALGGSLASTLSATGALKGDLSLGQSTANLKALGFLPVTAAVNLTPTTKVTGQLSGTSLSASVNVRIKLPSIKVFGIQLAGGANCQAAQVSTVALASTGAFTAAAGGTLAGTFAISNLTGCGALNGIVSPLTSGSGNAIALQLAPVPTA